MTDRPDAETETPLQRALRLKQEALQSKPRPPGSGLRHGDGAGVAAGASRPWMKR
jgi:hypothetical protein